MVYVLEKEGLSVNTANSRLNAMKFYFEQVLNSVEENANGQSDKEKIAFWNGPGQHLLIISRRKKENIDVVILWSDS
jgi:hypothetical protein